MTRTGKIARLPRAVREELNGRPLDGETGPRLVAWLNEQPGVRAALTEHFEGRAVTVQNLSEWRRGGWEDWCRRRETVELVAALGEEADDFDRLTAGGARLADRFATATALGLIKQFRAVEKMAEGPAKLRATLRVIGCLVRLRGCERQWERSKREGEIHERAMREGELAQVDRVNRAAVGAGARAVEAAKGAKAAEGNPSKSDQIQPGEIRLGRGIRVGPTEHTEMPEDSERKSRVAERGSEKGAVARKSYPYPVEIECLPLAHGHWGDHLIRAA